MAPPLLLAQPDFLSVARAFFEEGPARRHRVGADDPGAGDDPLPSTSGHGR